VARFFESIIDQCTVVYQPHVRTRAFDFADNRMFRRLVGKCFLLRSCAANNAFYFRERVCRKGSLFARVDEENRVIRNILYDGISQSLEERSVRAGKFWMSPEI